MDKKKSKSFREYSLADGECVVIRHCWNRIAHLHCRNKFISLSLKRSPPADHWCLVSGLPTYVAENGLVSS